MVKRTIGSQSAGVPSKTGAANPIAVLQSVVTTATTPFSSIVLPETEVWRVQPGEMPLILAGSGEGVVIQATVPATGTWTFYAGFTYDEVASTEI